MAQNKFWIMGGGILLSGVLLTGCGKKPELNSSNSYISSEKPLHVHNFNYITNRPTTKGFNLGTYQPFGYRTQKVENKSILFGPSSKDPYLSYECTDSALFVTTVNVVMAPFVLGMNILMGGICDQALVFDGEKFNEDAQKWVLTNNIDREKILEQYDTLLNSQKTLETAINSVVHTKNKELETIYSQYALTYAKNTPHILKKYNDTTGFYGNESLSKNIQPIYNRLDKRDSFTYKNYDYFIDKAFSCVSTQSCLTNMKTAEVQLHNQYEKDKSELPDVLSASISNYLKTLEEKTAVINLEVPKGEHQETFAKKTYYYTLKAPEQIKSTQKQLETLYTIKRVDFRDIYPAYSNKNQEIEIEFDPHTRDLRLRNNTKQFVQLNSISLYYGDNIYQLLDNQSANFARELAPESLSKNTIPNIAHESNYIDMTKTKSQAKKINFGFAVKYTIGDSTKNHTLYKQNQYLVYDLLKNI